MFLDLSHVLTNVFFLRGVFFVCVPLVMGSTEFFSIRYSYLYNNIYTETTKECYGAFTPGSNSSLLIASVTGVLDGCVGSLKRTKFGLYG